MPPAREEGGDDPFHFVSPGKRPDEEGGGEAEAAEPKMWCIISE